MVMLNVLKVSVGEVVTLIEDDDCIVPAGAHTVSAVNPDGSFYVGGRTAVWPHRIESTRPGRGNMSCAVHYDVQSFL